eukprot:TRINITY_DN45_c2_g1_i1.p1 TRINITY_DN45_c2_g1~~TRINITY_DN45_c2_g1_i1.p1  ORF type:complete len:1126 (+),score=236.17 TRINITY_DN45_c2_g1_i1:70-3447(+)
MTTESFRKEVGQKLSELQQDEDEEAKLEFPASYTSADRKYIHKIAESFRLHTQSVGTGDDRQIIVYKNPPAGVEPKRNFEKTGFVPNFEMDAGTRAQLRSIASSVPNTPPRVLLSNIKPISGRKLGRSGPTVSKPKAQVQTGPIEVGEEVESFWPDDETWLKATVTVVYEDGSFQIAWAEDGSESDVPVDYVRRIDPVGGGLEGAVEMSIEELNRSLEARRRNPQYAKLGEKREGLPAFQQRLEVVQLIRDNQVLLLSGETGCGKSTQVPQLIIDSCRNAKVLVMQPRKLAAITLAERIAAERCQNVGQDVGYKAPYSVKGANAKLVFATLGIFRRRMLEDPDLHGITHVVFDEVHERDKLADFNMIFVRDLLERRTDLRVILMSATLQMETFQNYFKGAATIAVPGRVFPVSELYMDEVAATLYKQPHFRQWLGPGILCGGISIPAGGEGDWNERAWKQVVFQHTRDEDREFLWGLREKGLESQMMAPMTKPRLIDGLRKHDVLQQSSLEFDYPLIEALILHIDRMYKEQQKTVKPTDPVKPIGTILVFLPGWGDIDRMLKRLVASFDQTRFKILPLHSQVSPEQQREIFEPPPQGVRKIVLTTNIAEASVTVEGTEFVIDSGRAKEVSYDPYLKVGTLTTSWISQASAKQRAGRAGRTNGGLCFHLFCRERYHKMDEFLSPELLRSPLEDSALSAKHSLLQMGSTELVSKFLEKAPSPPEKMSITNSIQLLVELGAFTEGEQLTMLGQHLTTSPLPPRLAKTILWSILFGCLDDALGVVSAASGFTRDPFKLAGMDREEAQKMKKELAAPFNSDHACLVNAIAGYSDSMNQQQFCDKWHLVAATMRQIRDQQNRIFTELTENKTDSFANRNRGNFKLLIAVLYAGIFPNIARRRGQSDYLEAQGGKVEARADGKSAYSPDKPDEWVFFQEMSQMESTYRLKLVSPIDPLPMLLVGGEGALNIESGGKGGKGGKWSKGGGKGGDITMSLLEGWLKFRCDQATADQVQRLRGALQSAFQGFCQKPQLVPPQETLALLDKVAALLGGGDADMIDTADDDSANRGVKRAASWGPSGQKAQSAPRLGKGTTPIRPSFGGSGGGGVWKSAGKGAGAFNKGGGFKGKGKK